MGSAPKGGGYYDHASNITTHRTGKVTDTRDQEWLAYCEQRVRALLEREAPDLLDVVFGEHTKERRDDTGRRIYDRTGA